MEQNMGKNRMIIYYLAAVYPRRFQDILNAGKMPSPAYKFNRLLAEGFSSIPNVQIRCIIPKFFEDALPGASQCRQEVANGVTYIYAGTGARSSCFQFLKSSIDEIKAAKQSGQVVLVCDALSLKFSFLCLWMRWVHGITNVAIVTDFPIFMTAGSKKIQDKLWGKICFYMMKKFDRYVLLTGQMGEHVNKRRKPECIMEGVCDGGSALQEEDKRHTNKKKVCLYAGSLQRKYGIDMLAEAFIRMNDPDCELHIYGDGDYREQLEKICSMGGGIRYCGVRPNEYIVEEERKATLLVNPRPTSEEYTKYSFPSKTLEYMASGTPLLMTRLPGLPQSYYPYVYLFEEESVEGYKAALEKVLGKTEDELFQMGKRARRFVIENKSADRQARRIFDELKLGTGGGR